MYRGCIVDVSWLYFYFMRGVSILPPTEALLLFIDFAIRTTINEIIKNKITRIINGVINKNHESLTHP